MIESVNACAHRFTPIMMPKKTTKYTRSPKPNRIFLFIGSAPYSKNTAG